MRASQGARKAPRVCVSPSALLTRLPSAELTGLPASLERLSPGAACVRVCACVPAHAHGTIDNMPHLLKHDRPWSAHTGRCGHAVRAVRAATRTAQTRTPPFPRSSRRLCHPRRARKEAGDPARLRAYQEPADAGPSEEQVPPACAASWLGGGMWAHPRPRPGRLELGKLGHLLSDYAVYQGPARDLDVPFLSVAGILRLVQEKPPSSEHQKCLK